jgi:hypothetical protein
MYLERKVDFNPNKSVFTTATDVAKSSSSFCLFFAIKAPVRSNLPAKTDSRFVACFYRVQTRATDWTAGRADHTPRKIFGLTQGPYYFILW